MKKSKVDILLVAAMLVVALVFMFKGGYGDKRLYIVNNNKKTEIPLKKAQLKYDNGNVVIEVNEDGARFTESTCQNKICIKQGWVKGCGQTAVCVPKHIAIVMECKEQDYDAISQ